MIVRLSVAPAVGLVSAAESENELIPAGLTVKAAVAPLLPASAAVSVVEAAL